MKRFVQRGVLIFVIAVFFTAGCQINPPISIASDANSNITPTPSHVMDPELEANRKLWNENRMSNYDMEIECYCGTGIGGPAASVMIQIRGGVAGSIVSTRIQDKRPTAIYKDLETVDKMFDYIQQLRDRSTASGKDANNVGLPAVKVKYDKKAGYPREMHILWTVAADAGSSFIIKKLEPVDSHE